MEGVENVGTTVGVSTWVAGSGVSVGGREVSVRVGSKVKVGRRVGVSVGLGGIVGVRVGVREGVLVGAWVGV